MINFLNVVFVKSASKYAEAPGNNFPEVLLCGKSNVGKSSFINAITGRKKLAYTSKNPGMTKLLNYYLVDNSFYFVDSPGYGYAKINNLLDKEFSKMMDDYFAHANPKLSILLLDARRELSENDIMMINYLNDKHIQLLLLFTKLDKINQSEKAQLEKHIKALEIENDYFMVSSFTSRNIDKVKLYIDKIIRDKL